MPIKGFPERKRMRRIGIVRLGIKVQSEKINPKTGEPIEYPQPTEYFVVADAPGLAEIYGEKPKVLNILLVSDDPGIAFPYYMMRYRQRGLICMGDGERILRRRGDNGKWEVSGGVNLQTGEIEPCRDLECPFAIRSESGRAECQPTGRLRFLCADNPTHGYYQLTVRKRAIEGFLGQMAFAKTILGGLTGYPWQLIMEQETVQLESGQRKLWIPQLEIEPKVFQELLRLKHAGKPLMLPEGITQATPEMEQELTEDLDYEASEEVDDSERFPETEEVEAIQDAFPQAEVKQVPISQEAKWAAGLKKQAKKLKYPPEAVEEFLGLWAGSPRDQERYENALEYMKAHAPGEAD